METLFDGLAKDIVEVMLDGLGTLAREHEVPAPTSQRADLRFVPDPERAEARRALGLFGRMTDEACLFEPFHEAPSIDDVTQCLRKLLNERRVGSLGEKRAAERSWLLCGGRPDTALAELRALPMRGWPAGFYDLSPAWGLSLVVLSELPRSDDTLALRLMGAGTTAAAAQKDLGARHEQVPKGRDLQRVVVQMLVAARRRGGSLPEAVMVDLTEADEFLRTERLEGRAEGLGPLVRQFGRKLGRPLTDAERATLRGRLTTHGPDRLGDVVLDLDAPALDAWLADADAR